MNPLQSLSQALTSAETDHHGGKVLISVEVAKALVGMVPAPVERLQGQQFYLVSALVEKPGKVGHRARVWLFDSKQQAIGSSLDLWQTDGWSIVSYECVLCEQLMRRVSVAAASEGSTE